MDARNRVPGMYSGLCGNRFVCLVCGYVMLMFLAGCSTLGTSQKDFEFLPTYPQAKNESMGQFVILPGKNGSIRERRYSFETHDVAAMVLAYYEEQLVRQGWRVMDRNPMEISFLYPNNCPAFFAYVRIRSINPALVETRLTRELCR